MGLQFKYGNLVHPECEVYPRKLEFRGLYSDRGMRWGRHYRMDIAGDIVELPGVPLTPNEINERIKVVEGAYALDYEDAGFLLDGAPTDHFLYTDETNNLSGNRCTAFSWDNALPTEFANTRSFSATIEAVFLDQVSDIFSFEETVTKLGTGGPTWRIYPTWNNVPVREQLTAQSPIIHVQSGRVVSLTPVNPPAPYWPLEEMQWRRKITRRSPQRHGNVNRYTHHVLEYTYYFERLGPEPTTIYNTWFT